MSAEILTYPINVQTQAVTTTSPQSLYDQSEPSRCTTDSLQAAPNGRYLLQQYNCQDTQWAQLFDLVQPEKSPALLPPGYFLDWSPSGDWFLYRQIEEDDVLLIAAANVSNQIPLHLPLGVYAAAFTPDGQQFLYAASAGLKLGSEIGLINLDDGAPLYQHTFPEQIVAFPRLSPNGSHLAYILMPDSNIPFTNGELWLANPTTGAPLNFLADVDAGHGYPPVWSPDSESLIYVHRENPDDRLADQHADALHSNLYQVDVTAGALTPLTAFSGSQVYDAIWSPDGQTLAFTASDAVWQLTPGHPPIQVSQNAIARHPVWLVEPANP